MSQFFYDGQIKKYLTQFIRAMSGFCYEDASGTLHRVPARGGDMTRQVGSILNQNSENTLQSAPFIACYIKDIKYNRERLQDPTFVDKVHVRTREFDENTNQFLYTQGGNYTVERIMPSPYDITFNADIWTTNLEQKFQLWEQLVVLFNPSLEIQANDNYLDWSSLSLLELTDGSVWESRSIPQGNNNDISITTLQFRSPVWINPPVKVKKMGIITKIISNIFAEQPGTGANGEWDDAALKGDIFGGFTPDARVTVTFGNFDLLVLDNTAVLVPQDYSNVSQDWVTLDVVEDRPSWHNILDHYPGKFIAGISQIRLTKPNGLEIVAQISLNPNNDALMNLNIDSDTVPSNTIIDANGYSRGTIDAIIDPSEFNPNVSSGQNVDLRYLLLSDVVINNTVAGPDAWSSIAVVSGQPNGITARENDIIQWDGNQWNIIFDSGLSTSSTYVTNTFTGIQYKHENRAWSKSFEGIYSNDAWRLVL